MIGKTGLLALLLVACGGSQPAPPPPAPAQPQAHDHEHGFGHRFERADDWAKKFDDPARDEWQKPGDVVAAMGITAGMTVADVGAGTGYFEGWLSRAVGTQGAVLALDVEPDMVRYLNDRAAREHYGNVRPGLVTMDDPKLVAESVDRILVVDTWHHISARVDYAKKLRNALRPGGKVFIVDFKLDAKQGPPPKHRLAPEEVVKDLAGAGLQASVVPTSLPEQYIVVGAR